MRANEPKTLYKQGKNVFHHTYGWVTKSEMRPMVVSRHNFCRL
jgi:hypothetical protein